MKVHVLTDIQVDTPQFVMISDAKIHFKNILTYLNLAQVSMIVFDRAYNYYQLPAICEKDKGGRKFCLQVKSKRKI